MISGRILALSALALLASPACSTIGTLKHLNDMSVAEVDRYAARVSFQVEAVTAAALAEGDLTRDAAIRVAVALDGLAAQTIAPGLGALEIDLEGYGGLALALIISEVDAQLDARGAFGSGSWVRAAPILRGMSEGILRAVAE